MDQKITTEITTSHLLDALNDTQLETLDMVRQQYNADRIREELDVSTKKTYQILKGLYGNVNGVPAKWQVEKPFLKLRENPKKASLKYELNSRGWKALFASGSISEKENNQDSEQSRDVPGEVMLRPHYLRSKHFINRTGGNDDSWFVELKKHFSDTEDGSGFKLFWSENRAEVYRNSIQLRIDLSMEKCSVEEMFNRYLEERNRFISHVEKRLNGLREDISVQVRSNPELVEASMLTQEWAEFDSAFANWYMDNRDEFQEEDGYGGQFIVRNERDERIATVDCSCGRPEFEYVDSQEAKNHLQNMKDLVLWGASQEITPADFSNLSWLRENMEFFESFYDRVIQLDEVEEALSELEEMVDVHSEQIDGLSSRVDGNEESIEGLERSVDVHGSQIDAHGEQMQRHRELISDQDDKVQDAVERVQGVQVKQDRLQSSQEQIVDTVESVSESQEGLQNVQSSLANQQEVLTENVKLLQRDTSTIRDYIHEERSSRKEVRKLSESNQELIKEIRKNRLGNRIKRTVKKASKGLASVVMSVL